MLMSGNWPITVVLSRELTYQASDNTETVAEGPEPRLACA